MLDGKGMGVSQRFSGWKHDADDCRSKQSCLIWLMVSIILSMWASWRWRWEFTSIQDGSLPADPLLVVSNLSVGEAWAVGQAWGKKVRPVLWKRPGTRNLLSSAGRVLGAEVGGSRAEILAALAAVRRAGAVPCLIRVGISEEEVVELARQSGSTVVPVEVWNGDSLLWRKPAVPLSRWEGRAHFLITRGEALASATIERDALAKALLDTAAAAVEKRPVLNLHLAEIIVRNLKRRFLTPVIIDAFQQGRTLKGGMLLAVAWLLAEWIRREIPERRVGVVLPPGLGATIANLACLLADKCPVNLNFSIGRDANEKAIAQAGLRHVFTAEAFVAKVGDFPWPEKRLDLPATLASIGKRAVILRTLRVGFTPVAGLLRAIGVPAVGGSQEAGLLFTSGSSGDPKGVVLSHRNLLGNILQVEAILPGSEIKSILGCLPIFHSFGFTVTLWWPLAGGPQVVTYVSPLDTAKLAETIHRYAVSLMVTTPTFLRAFLRKATPEQLRSLVLVVTGAEKLPTPLLSEFEEKFGVPVCEGYGMTEASPVISTNLPDRVVLAAGGRAPGRTIGTVGRLVPGVSVRVKHPETGDELALDQTGMLWFRGVNVFRGYLNDPVRSAQVLQEGWYVSGDIGRLDAQGFLVIEGRLSRFSKIGGEMVPHGTIEAALLETLRGKIEGEFGLAVVGARDAAKGEALVVLCTHTLDSEALRKELVAKGLPNLWVPKIYFQVEAIPTLASGKLDIRRCHALAEQLVGGAAR
jgi:acyl-[acyl-carrier-protein]-phospholipid O-acyltransferase/long-chain-fatty-acid--[acyl-carrier-protein] ligase